MDKQNITLSKSFAASLSKIYNICKNHSSDGTQFQIMTESGKKVEVMISFNEVDDKLKLSTPYGEMKGGK